MLWAFPALSGEEAPKPKPKADDSGEDLVADGWKAYLTGKYKEAGELFEEVLEENESDAKAMEGMLEVEHITGKYKSALRRGRKWLAKNGKADRVWTVLGEVRSTVGNYDNAMQAFRKAVELNRENYRAQADLAEVLQYVGKKDEANDIILELFDIITEEAAPDKFSVEDYVAFARACVVDGETDLLHEANDRLFTQAFELDPEYAPLFVSWGMLFLDKYNYPDAKGVFKDYIKINPNHPDINFGMALVMLQKRELGQKRIPEAMKYIDKTLAVNPNHVDSYVVMAYLSIVDTLHDEARGHLGEALKINPNRLDALGIFAASHWLQSEMAQHDRITKRAIEINPRPAQFYNQIAQVIEGKFRYREAYEYSKKAISKDDTYWPAYYTAGSNALRLGLTEEGRTLLENAFQVDDFNVRCYNALQLMDYMDREYTTMKSEHFTLRMKTNEVPFLKYIAEPHLNGYLAEMTRKYKMTPRYPITVEFFSAHQDFSARTVGLPGIGASGACFGELVTTISPRAMSPAIASWIVTLRHEFAHVITLQKTKNRLPRWFTEGLSVYEESQYRPSWQRLDDYMFLSALYEDKLLPLKKLDSGFTKPKWRMQVLLCYYHGYVIVEFIKEKYGFEKINELLDAFKQGLVLDKAIGSVFGQTPDEFDVDFFAYAKKRYGKFRVAPHFWPDTIRRMKVSLDKKKTAEKYARLARAYLRAGKDADYEINIHRAKKLDPDCPDIHLVMGIRYNEEGEKEKAKKAFYKAIAMGVHDLFTAHFNLALIAQREENEEVQERELIAALEAFPRAAKRGQPANVYALLAALYEKQGKTDKRMDELAKWCALDFRALKERKILAKHYQEKKLYEKLEPILEDLTFLNPFDNSIAPMFLECYYKTGRYEKAVEISRIMDEQKIYKLSAEHLIMQAESYEKTGRRKDAIKSLQKAVLKEKDNEKAKKLLKELGGEMPKPPEKKEKEKEPDEKPEESPDYEKPDKERKEEKG